MTDQDAVNQAKQAAQRYKHRREFNTDVMKRAIALATKNGWEDGYLLTKHRISRLYMHDNWMAIAYNHKFAQRLFGAQWEDQLTKMVLNTKPLVYLDVWLKGQGVY